jgi:glycosyltransferase involved in cell wall biosynthesis
MRYRNLPVPAECESGSPQAAVGGGPAIAVLIPCCDEAKGIARVIGDFRTALPKATIYVYDNNSTDATSDIARAAGAIVRHERLQGKGNVVRRMFADVEADIYVLVDGDDTYDAGSAESMVACLVDNRLDFLNGKRVGRDGRAYRPAHRFGNRVLTGIVGSVFRAGFDDMLSGYKLFSRRFVKSFPALSTGFEIETELTVHALELRLPCAEMPTLYKERAAGSVSKLRTFRDGFRILSTILILLKEEKPLLFFSILAFLFALSSIILGTPVIITYFETGLVPRLPTAVLATGLMILAWLSEACGLILETVTRGRREMKRLHYLAQPPLDAPRQAR